MNRKMTILCLIALSSSFVATQSALAQNNLLNKSPLPSSRILNRFGLERAWWGQATMHTTRDKIQHIGIDERSVVVISSAGIVTAFDAEGGQKMWTTRIGRSNQTAQSPVMNEKMIFIIANLKLYALDRLNGDLIWKLNLPQAASTAPSADEERIYVGMNDGSVFAFDLFKIKQLYQERLLPEYSDSTRAWRYKSGGRITSPPVVTGHVLSFASTDHSVYTVNSRSRNMLYQFETDAPITAPLVKNGKYIFVASEDFNFYCLDAVNGQVRWKFLSGLPIRKSSYVIGNQVFVLPDAGGIISLNTENGLHHWKKPQLRATSFLTATRKIIFTADRLGNVLLVNRETGKAIGILPLIPFNVKPNNALTDRLFLAKENGLIVMIREQGSDFPTYHKHPARRPILPELFDSKAKTGEDSSTLSVPGNEQ